MFCWKLAGSCTAKQRDILCLWIMPPPPSSCWLSRDDCWFKSSCCSVFILHRSSLRSLCHCLFVATITNQYYYYYAYCFSFFKGHSWFNHFQTPSSVNDRTPQPPHHNDEPWYQNCCICPKREIEKKENSSLIFVCDTVREENPVSCEAPLQNKCIFCIISFLLFCFHLLIRELCLPANSHRRQLETKANTCNGQ